MNVDRDWRGAPDLRFLRHLPVQARAGDRARDRFETDADAIAWTRRAVHVEFIDKHGRKDSAWVWASAVARR
ncbi:hypothetical protein GCM10007967_28040 [Xylanimonas ulmi]